MVLISTAHTVLMMTFDNDDNDDADDDDDDGDYNDDDDEAHLQPSFSFN